jgi:hypothetical protein
MVRCQWTIRVQVAPPSVVTAMTVLLVVSSQNGSLDCANCEKQFAVTQPTSGVAKRGTSRKGVELVVVRQWSPPSPSVARRSAHLTHFGMGT